MFIGFAQAGRKFCARRRKQGRSGQEVQGGRGERVPVAQTGGLTPKRPGPKTAHKLDWEALRRHVTTHDDLTQAEAARHFGVSRHCIWNALHKMGWTRKKTTGYKECSPLQRRKFLHLRERYLRRGLRPVHVDECGFTPSVTRRYGYAPKGQRVYGLTAGHRRPRTSLIAARIGPDFAEPFLFDGTCNAAVFNSWLRARLCPRLTREHLVIMDNAAFHKAPETAQLIRHTSATLLFLPPYSPDLNPIEHDFAALKKHREYHETASIDQIVKAYQ
ncbi:MAG TPA: IS630 family transposase [Nitrospira sp.]|nr:IS630 family transposase [Nitrospira sp.]